MRTRSATAHTALRVGCSIQVFLIRTGRMRVASTPTSLNAAKDSPGPARTWMTISVVAGRIRTSSTTPASSSQVALFSAKSAVG